MDTGQVFAFRGGGRSGSRVHRPGLQDYWVARLESAGAGLTEGEIADAQGRTASD